MCLALSMISFFLIPWPCFFYPLWFAPSLALPPGRSMLFLPPLLFLRIVHGRIQEPTFMVPHPPRLIILPLVASARSSPLSFFLYLPVLAFIVMNFFPLLRPCPLTSLDFFFPSIVWEIFPVFLFTLQSRNLCLIPCQSV